MTNSSISNMNMASQLGIVPNDPSPSGSMNSADWRRWLKNTLIFSSPAILALLMALQSGSDLHFALGAAYSAGISSLIDLIKKYNAGQ